MVAANEKEAWAFLHSVLEITEQNKEKSEGAGYPIYDTDKGWISDLNDRLEVNFNNGESFNIWFKSF